MTPDPDIRLVRSAIVSGGTAATASVLLSAVFGRWVDHATFGALPTVVGWCGALGGIVLVVASLMALTLPGRGRSLLLSAGFFLAIFASLVLFAITDSIPRQPRRAVGRDLPAAPGLPGHSGNEDSGNED